MCAHVEIEQVFQRASLQELAELQEKIHAAQHDKEQLEEQLHVSETHAQKVMWQCCIWVCTNTPAHTLMPRSFLPWVFT